MSYLPSDASTLCISLCDTDGAHNICLDIHPSRWSLDIPLEDALMFVLAQIHIASNNPNARSWSLGKNEINETHQQEHFTIHPGGMAAHTGAPLAGHIAIHTTPTHIVFPDGRRVDRATFSGWDYKHMQVQYARRKITDIASGNTDESIYTSPNGIDASQSYARHYLGFAAGFISVLNNTPFANWGHRNHHQLLHMAALMAFETMAPIHKSTPRTGKELQPWLEKKILHLIHTLLESWALRPDRAWSPTTCIIAPWMHALTATLEPGDVAAGKAAGHAILKAAPTDEDFQALSRADTAHRKLAWSVLEKSVERDIYAAYAQHPALLRAKAKRTVLDAIAA